MNIMKNPPDITIIPEGSEKVKGLFWNYVCNYDA